MGVLSIHAASGLSLLKTWPRSLEFVPQILGTWVCLGHLGDLSSWNQDLVKGLEVELRNRSLEIGPWDIEA